MIEIRKGGGVYIDGIFVDQNSVDMKEFMFANIGSEITFVDSKVEDLVNILYNLKSFIHDYYSENYETIKAFLLSISQIKHTSLEFYKELSIEDNFIFILPDVKLSFEEHIGTKNVSELPIIINNCIEMDSQDPEDNIEINVNGNNIQPLTTFTLLDIMDALFKSLIHRFIDEGVV